MVLYELVSKTAPWNPVNDRWMSRCDLQLRGSIRRSDSLISLPCLCSSPCRQFLERDICLGVSVPGGHPLPRNQYKGAKHILNRFHELSWLKRGWTLLNPILVKKVFDSTDMIRKQAIRPLQRHIRITFAIKALIEEISVLITSHACKWK